MAKLHDLKESIQWSHIPANTTIALRCNSINNLRCQVLHLWDGNGSEGLEGLETVVETEMLPCQDGPSSEESPA